MHHSTALPLIVASAFLLTPAEGETVHLSVNSVTACPYCTGLHGNLGRMAGCDSKGIEGAKTDEECASKAGSTSSNEHEIALYARTFAKSGYSADAQKTLSAKVGQTKAKCVNAMCLFLKWGSYGGNTINDTNNAITAPVTNQTIERTRIMTISNTPRCKQTLDPTPNTT